MQYIFLIYSRERDTSVRPNEELEALISAHWAVTDDARERGVFVDNRPLKSTATAKVVRVQGESRLVTDGPYAETKEQIAGYYIFECESMDEALEWAARIPTACKGGAGCVEVRPISELPVRAG